MGLWSYYFFAKLFLHFGDYMGFNPLLNFALAIFTILPAKHLALRIAKQSIAIPAGIALLYHDSWLPPFARVLSQAEQLSQFSAGYLLDLTSRLINPTLLACLAGLFLAYWLISRKLRMSTLVFIGLTTASLAPLLAIAPAQIAPDQTSASAGRTDGVPTPEELNAELQTFYQKEAARQISLPASAENGQPFDVIYLHICSLAQDDVAYINQSDSPFFKRFNIRFNNFSSAASYSGPAAIRLMRSGCGQPPHEALYRPADPGCYLYGEFQRAGFEPHLLMNHSGQFGGFLGAIRSQGGFDIPLDKPEGVPVAMHSFDDLPIYDDYEMLSRWWDQRLKMPASRVMLYYNSVSLHDGNVVSGGSRNPRDSYISRFAKFTDDLEKFFEKIKASDRRAIVVFVPEHGANVRGDKMQISGLREIPSPAIGLIPVGIRLIGPKEELDDTQTVVTQASSHFAITNLLATFLSENPFDAARQDMAHYIRGLPETAFVAENEGMIVMRDRGRYYLRNPDRSWIEYKNN